MLYDLNIPWTPSSAPAADAELERTLRMSSQLGYGVVALNHTLTPPIPANITPPRLPSFSPSPSSSWSSSSSTSRLPTLLRRATVEVADPSTHHRLPQIAAAYDVVALRPTTEKAFAGACATSLSASTSDLAPLIISLDLAAFHSFRFRPKPVMAAVARGARFEVCYAQALAAAAGSRPRALFVANLVALVRASRGRGLLVSSEAPGPRFIRGPADVVNLLAVWGLAPDRAADALGPVPRAVVANEGLRRTGFRGVVRVVSWADEGKPREGKTAAGGEEALVVAQSEGKMAGAADDGAAATKGVKRKADEETAGGGGDDGLEPKPMSKRQMKKLRKAQMQQQQQQKQEQS